MAHPLSVHCPTCDAPIGIKCTPPVGTISVVPGYCQERKLKADMDEEQAVEQLIYEW